MNYERLKSEMKILRVNKEKFTRELQHKDRADRSYFEHEIQDKDMLENILEIWTTSTKKDEETINEHWVKKIESLRKAFEKDKNNKNRKEEDTNKEHGETNAPLDNHAHTPENIRTSNDSRNRFKHAQPSNDSNRFIENRRN